MCLYLYLYLSAKFSQPLRCLRSAAVVMCAMCVGRERKSRAVDVDRDSDVAAHCRNVLRQSDRRTQLHTRKC